MYGSSSACMISALFPVAGASYFVLFYQFLWRQPPWTRRHPNRVILNRLVFDFVLVCLVIVAYQVEPQNLWDNYDSSSEAKKYHMDISRWKSFENEYRTANHLAAALAWFGQARPFFVCALCFVSRPCAPVSASLWREWAGGGCKKKCALAWCSTSSSSSARSSGTR